MDSFEQHKKWLRSLKEADYYSEKLKWMIKVGVIEPVPEEDRLYPIEELLHFNWDSPESDPIPMTRAELKSMYADFVKRMSPRMTTEQRSRYENPNHLTADYIHLTKCLQSELNKQNAVSNHPNSSTPDLQTSINSLQTQSSSDTLSLSSPLQTDLSPTDSSPSLTKLANEPQIQTKSTNHNDEKLTRSKSPIDCRQSPISLTNPSQVNKQHPNQQTTQSNLNDKASNTSTNPVKTVQSAVETDAASPAFIERSGLRIGNLQSTLIIQSKPQKSDVQSTSLSKLDSQSNSVNHRESESHNPNNLRTSQLEPWTATNVSLPASEIATAIANSVLFSPIKQPPKSSTTSSPHQSNIFKLYSLKCTEHPSLNQLIEQQSQSPQFTSNSNDRNSIFDPGIDLIRSIA